MRNFNTTAVNLRATLDDVDPLVDASMPVAQKLQPFTAALRGFATDAVPDRPRPRRDRQPARRQQRPGRADPPAAAPGAGSPSARCDRNGASRPGAFPESADALVAQPAPARLLPPLHHRAWSAGSTTSATPASIDANGGIGRISTTFNLFSRLRRRRPACRTCLAGADPPADQLELANGLTVDQLETLPGLQRARPRRRLDAVHRQRHPRLRPEPGAAGTMRRIALIIASLLLAAGATAARRQRRRRRQPHLPDRARQRLRPRHRVRGPGRRRHRRHGRPELDVNEAKRAVVTVEISGAALDLPRVRHLLLAAAVADRRVLPRLPARRPRARSCPTTAWSRCAARSTATRPSPRSRTTSSTTPSASPSRSAWR